MVLELGEPREVIAFRYELEFYERKGYRILDCALLVETFPWWKRWLVRMLWNRWTKKRLGRHFRNPYVSIRAVVAPPTEPEDAAVAREGPSSDGDGVA